MDYTPKTSNSTQEKDCLKDNSTISRLSQSSNLFLHQWAHLVVLLSQLQEPASALMNLWSL